MKTQQKLKVLRNPHSPITKLFNEGLDSKGIVCELVECGECGFRVLIPHPMKQYFDCPCGYLLDSCATIRVKAIPMLPTIQTKNVKRNRKNRIKK